MLILQGSKALQVQQTVWGWMTSERVGSLQPICIKYMGDLIHARDVTHVRDKGLLTVSIATKKKGDIIDLV